MANSAKLANAAANWLQGMQGASAAYTAGVQGVTQAPSQAAIAAIPRYQQGVNDAVASGRMQQALQSVTLQSWQTACTSKGAARLASGASAAKDKVSAFWQKWAPTFVNISNTVAAMPKGGKGNAMARLSTTYDMLKQAAGKTIS